MRPAGGALPVRLLRPCDGGGGLCRSAGAGLKICRRAPDILREGENGLTADPFDPAAFGEALEEMLNRDFPTEKCRVSLGEKFSFREAARGYVQAVRMVEGEK